MKIKNQSVMIQVGKKQFDFTNLILNTYLKQMINAIEGDDLFDDHAPSLDFCYLRFANREEEFDFDEDSILSIDDFDIALNTKNLNIEASPNAITVNIQYGGQDILDDYIGLSVNYLAFADKNNIFYACVDVSNASIIINPNEDFTVYRKDILSTNALFSSNNKIIAYPLHLINHDEKKILAKGNDEYPDVMNNIFAKLRTYGFGYNPNTIIEEFDINNAEFQETSLLVDIYNPQKDGLYPDYNIFPSNNIFPGKAEYSYIIFKFKIYQMVVKYSFGEEPAYSSIDTGLYYTLSMPLKSGDYNYLLKYERGN